MMEHANRARNPAFADPLRTGSALKATLALTKNSRP